jgi:hypothetical protein
MAEEATDRAMEEACARMVRRIWDDEGYAASAVANPGEALAENGWTPPEGVQVVLELVEPGTFAEESAKAAEQGNGQAANSSRLTLKLPSAPLDSERLSDEQLKSVAGGEGSGKWDNVDPNWGGHVLRNWT